MPGENATWGNGFWGVAKWGIVYSTFERKKKDAYLDFINTFYRQHKTELKVLAVYLRSKRDTS